MTSFDLNEHLLPLHPSAIALRDLSGLIKAYFKKILLKNPTIVLPEFSFSELDQAFVLWGVVALAIFSTAQFSALSWTTQAYIDAVLTSAGIASTSQLTWRLACSERLRWVVVLWAVLMTGGMVATAYGIFGGVGVVLMNLCPLWLGLCAVGYLAMAVGLRSRSFSAASLVHGLAIAFLTFDPSWQFLNSGLVMASTLFFFSVVPWDMRATEADELCGLQPKARLPEPSTIKAGS